MIRTGVLSAFSILAILAIVVFFLSPAIAADSKNVIVASYDSNNASSGFTPENNELAKTVAVSVHPVRYKVRKGENLVLLARRFGVKVSDIRSPAINPKLAKRKNSNLLLAGERIMIPVYRVESSSNTLSNISEEMVVMPKNDFAALKEHEKVQASEVALLAGKLTEKENADTIKRVFIIILLVGFLNLILIMFVWIAGNNKKRISVEKNTPKLPSLENSSEDEIIQILRTAKGEKLAKAMGLPIAYDETGKTPVLTRNIDRAIDKRPYLGQLPINAWADAMKSNTATGAAATPNTTA